MIQLSAPASSTLTTQRIDITLGDSAVIMLLRKIPNRYIYLQAAADSESTAEQLERLNLHPSNTPQGPDPEGIKKGHLTWGNNLLLIYHELKDPSLIFYFLLHFYI